MDSFSLPLQWALGNLWWVLPALAAALGAGLRRALPRAAALYGAPVCLLAGLAGAVAWRGTLLAAPLAHSSFWNSGLALLALAALAAAGAAACAVRPTRAGCAAAAAAAVPWLACMAAALYGHFRRSFGALHPGLLALTLAGLAAAVLGFAGAFAPAPQPEAAPETAPEPPPAPAEPAGQLTVLCGALAGQRLPLPAGEELVLGSDAACCHLVLQEPGLPPCLCAVRWLPGRNTYLVACRAPQGLLWADGSRTPGGSTVEVLPGAVCRLPGGGAPAAQFG